MREEDLERQLVRVRLLAAVADIGLRSPEVESMLHLRVGDWDRLASGEQLMLTRNQERRARLPLELIRWLDVRMPSFGALARWFRRPRLVLDGESPLCWIRRDGAALPSLVRAVRREARS